MILRFHCSNISSKSMVFYSDPGHGWLKIEKSILNMLGIADKISTCSYMRGNFAYLEEDCDAKLFRDTLIEKGFEKESVQKFMNAIEDKSSEKRSKIRSYQTYLTN